MKKLVLLVAAVLSMSIAANAQFKLGVKAGLNLSTTNSSGDKTLAGFNAGLLGQFKFAGTGFAIQPEVLYSLQGAKGSAEGIDAKLHLSYINIPIMVQYYIISGLNVELGPQVGFLASAKAKASQGGITATVDMKDYFNSVDFGVNIGAAYQLPVIPLGFFARYNFGLTNLGTKEAAAGDDAGHNRVFQIGAFYKF